MQTFYVLHTRPFRDTSLLLDCLTEHDGLLSLVARGAKRPKSPLRSVCVQYSPLVGDWFGRGELKTLKAAEPLGVAKRFEGVNLFSALYVNELITKVVHKHDPCPMIFSLYQGILNTSLTEVDLRQFEFRLLAYLGYEINFYHDAATGAAISAEENYYFDPNIGFTPMSLMLIDPGPRQVFAGRDLIALSKNNLEAEEVRQTAKRLSRLAFSPLLKCAPLKSRELFA